MSKRTGKCLCGAVSFHATDVPQKFGACHCEQCRRNYGSALLGVSVPEGKVTWTGDIATYQSSSWAERAHCPTCGTPLYYRVTADNEWAGNYEIPIGLFDDPNGFQMSSEIYIDHKPDSFAYTGEGRKVLTRAECVEKFELLDSE